MHLHVRSRHALLLQHKLYVICNNAHILDRHHTQSVRVHERLGVFHAGVLHAPCPCWKVFDDDYF